MEQYSLTMPSDLAKQQLELESGPIQELNVTPSPTEEHPEKCRLIPPIAKIKWLAPVIAALEHSASHPQHSASHSASHPEQSASLLPQADLSVFRWQSSDARTSAKVTVHNGPEFERLRSRIFKSEEDFLQSLRSLVTVKTKYGMSGASMSRSADGKLFTKTVARFIMAKFKSFAASYFQHLDVPHACSLSLILGVYRVKFGPLERYRVIVTQSVAPIPPVVSKRVYDLKGVVCFGSRSDAEFEKDGVKHLEPHAREELFRSLHTDTKFLADCDIMDYSLLLHETADMQLFGGVIDYLMTYHPVMTCFPHLGFPLLVAPPRFRERMLVAFERYFPPAG